MKSNPTSGVTKVPNNVNRSPAKPVDAGESYSGHPVKDSIKCQT